ncbi:MAG: sigma-54-dependent Fis family transcriptional regulator [Bacteroidetes bacterium]|nr:sigma-54-dependent Fis family transcriptional regulator [Bacteroidota bacterium]
MKTVLIADDEQAIRDTVRMILEYEKFAVVQAEDGPGAMARVAAGGVDLVLLDIKMPVIDGMRVLETLREQHPELPVVMISGHATIDTAVEATRLGAYDFLQKPIDRERLIIVVRNATEVKHLREQLEGKTRILGRTQIMKDLLALIDRVAPTEARVLITGENGSGKELVAKALHRLSKRSSRPLIEVNCAAIPNELIESELFGHERGSFTGATNQRIGKFELADGGTIFLDEIGDMSLTAQAKVLRALEEGKVERVGGTKPIVVDVRVIAATNKNLGEAVRTGLFREDLYHRLNVIPIRVPSLRERREDIPVLAAAFVDEVCTQNGMAPKRFSDEALRLLQGMEWRGNVRELRNTVERLVIMTPESVIARVEVFPQEVQQRGEVEDLLLQGLTFQEFKDRAEAAFIRKQLEAHEWNVSKTAEALEIQRSHLYNKMRKYGLERT